MAMEIQPSESMDIDEIDSCPRFDMNRLSLALSGSERAAPSDLHKAVEYVRKLKNPNMDRKKFKRILAKRIAVQKYNLRLDKYIRGLERKVDQLKATISTLTSKIESCKEDWKLVHQQNQSLWKLYEVRSDQARLVKMKYEDTQMEVYKLKTLIMKRLCNNQFCEEKFPVSVRVPSRPETAPSSSSTMNLPTKMEQE